MENITTERFTLGMSLYSNSGERKYINAEERARFLAAAFEADDQTRTLCLILLFSGCRISEALALTAGSFQLDAGLVAIRSLKKRHRHFVREVPIPSCLIKELDQAFRLRHVQQDMSCTSHQRLWPWGRTWGWKKVKAVMRQAGIFGAQASPKGLRHGFGIHAIQSGIPLNLVQKWLGHSQLSTTAIYANAVGPEEIEIAERMWS